MKSKRLQFEYRSNASSLHRAVGDYLRSSDLFKFHKIFQEYPVNLINEGYENSRHRFDWVITDLKIVIEVHGEQHTKICRWGNIDHDEAFDQFVDGKTRDSAKKQAAIEAGFTYIEIPYNEIRDICDDYIVQKMKEDTPDK